jgi:hypothetical protein
MNTSRTAQVWRSPGKSALAGLLVMVLLFSAIASAAPCLHEWLHADHQAPAHHCLVTVLEHGQTETTCSWMQVLAPARAVAYRSLAAESFFISHDLALHPERGPPALS